jgi:hypothetical protein
VDIQSKLGQNDFREAVTAGLKSMSVMKSVLEAARYELTDVEGSELAKELSFSDDISPSSNGR